MAAATKEIVRLYREDLWNHGNLRTASQILDENCVYHFNDPITSTLGTGPERAMKEVLLYREAFPDLLFTIEDLFAEDDRALVRWTLRGTHEGELFGVPPSKMKITVTGMDMYRVSEGKIQECWTNWDTLGFMQQLGLEPIASGASA